MPSMNPDGFEAVKKPDCFYSNGRYGGAHLSLCENRKQKAPVSLSPLVLVEEPGSRVRARVRSLLG